MNRFVWAASVVSGAVGLALATAPAMSADPAKDTGSAKPHLEKCYGINAAGKNDCATAGAGAHSCAGQATAARDPKSFVLIPAGDCAKIAGGTANPS